MKYFEKVQYDGPGHRRGHLGFVLASDKEEAYQVASRNHRAKDLDFEVEEISEEEYKEKKKGADTLRNQRSSIYTK